MRRPLAIVGLVASALACATSARGSSLTYTFTNTSGGPVARADFEIIPAGSVQAPVIGTDPNTGLPRTASPVTFDAANSSGFDVNNVSTALGTGTGVQGLRLLFGEKQSIQDGKIVFTPVPGADGSPPRFLDEGGTVTFALNLDPAYDGAVKLVSLTKGVPDPILVATNAGGGPPAGGGGGGGGGSDPDVPVIPEPMTLVVWSSVLALGAVRARQVRASR